MADKKLKKTVQNRSAAAAASPKAKSAAKVAAKPAVKRSARPEVATKAAPRAAKPVGAATSKAKVAPAPKPIVTTVKTSKGSPAAKPAPTKVASVSKPALAAKVAPASKTPTPVSTKPAPASKPPANAAKPVVAAKPATVAPTSVAATSPVKAAPAPARQTVLVKPAETIAAPAKVTPVAAAPAKVAPAPAVPVAAPAPVQTAPVAAAPARMSPLPPTLRKPVATGKAPSFKTEEYIVYPAHGVGQITAVEEQVVAGYKLELFVISFVKDKMILKVPLPKVVSVGMRKLAEPPVVKRALDTLTGRARIKRTMWSRRAQEYEAKINSGDLVAIAEVVRDLYRSDAQPEQSYSERQLYEAALDRIARELAVVENLTDSEALKLIDGQLQKGPRRGKADDVEAASDETDDEQAGIVEAA